MFKSAPTVRSEGDEPLDWGTNDNVATDDDEATHIDKAIAKPLDLRTTILVIVIIRMILVGLNFLGKYLTFLSQMKNLTYSTSSYES